MNRRLLNIANCLGCSIFLTACIAPKFAKTDINRRSDRGGDIAWTSLRASEAQGNARLTIDQDPKNAASELYGLTKTARIFFNKADYGQAISYAKKALAVNPNDQLALSIAAVSGLRVSSAALAELRRNKKLKANSKSEADALADLLRSSVGEQDLVPKSEN